MPERKTSRTSSRSTGRTAARRTVARRTNNEEEMDKLDRKIDKLLNREELSKAKDRTMEFIDKHPVSTILISAAVGAGVALLINNIAPRRELPPPTLRDRLREWL